MPVFQPAVRQFPLLCFASYFMQYGPPPLFKQGTPARVKVIIFVLAAVALLFVDSHLQVLSHVRKVVGMVLYPVQRVAMVPRDIYDVADEYLTSVATLHEEVSGLREKSMQDATLLQRAQLLESENAQLRELLGMSKRVSVKSLPAEILYDARNTFVRKVILNKGSQDGVLPGQPVIDDKGVIGQVTDVYLKTCEVTLLTDKDQAIPVLNVRSGERSVAYGRGQSGYLELRFMMANADIRPGWLSEKWRESVTIPPGRSITLFVNRLPVSTGTDRFWFSCPIRLFLPGRRQLTERSISGNGSIPKPKNQRNKVKTG